MPTTLIRWRPTNNFAVTKNVILTVNANGAVQHWHTTSGKLLNTIYDDLNQLLSADYNNDGSQFVTGGSDTVLRVYDEQTRQEILRLDGDNKSGHSNRVFCVKYCTDNPNLIVSGGWDLAVKVWDIREPNPIKSIFGPYICGDTIDIKDGMLLTGAY